eukprot:6227225-Amphidinium_carterae.1
MPSLQSLACIGPALLVSDLTGSGFQHDIKQASSKNRAIDSEQLTLRFERHPPKKAHAQARLLSLPTSL